MAVCLKFLGQQYFIPIALILGFVDLLPLIGPVIVLLPWSIIELFIFSNINKGVALLIILTFLDWPPPSYCSKNYRDICGYSSYIISNFSICWS